MSFDGRVFGVFVKGWLDSYYCLPIAGTVAVTVFVLVVLSTWLTAKRKFILSALLFLCAQYMLWRGLYTLNTDSLAGMAVSGTVYLAEFYNLAHIGFFVYQAWDSLDRATPPMHVVPTVDLLVPIVHEPLFVLERTLVGCLEQDYPRERFQVYVLDDGHRPEVEQLARALGCQYLRRPNRGESAKAGNLNYALARSSGEYIAVFDTDHVPVRSFLKETVPFFEDPTVGFVQTAHHFYNRDIFQRNLRLQQALQDEQRLFFRVIQPGRDRHNSAFFAGSSGLFRRAALQEVGGFREETVTEDLHTSLLVHAKGYRSCYVNRVLSAGLLPETLDGYLTQRMRWATGAIQLLFRASPLTTPGLTAAQRLDYLGAVHYFLFGLPRIICLVAPLPWLYFDIAVLRADPLMLVALFFSYFLAFLLTTHAVSKGMRSAIWSDIYETMLCFAVTRAVAGTIFSPRARRPFVVTPKGEMLPRAPVLNRLILPHLILFGLLVGGVLISLMRASSWDLTSGTALSVFWAAANLLLLGAVISTAYEPPQRQQRVRVPMHLPCEVVLGHRRVMGTTSNLSELGAQLVVPEPIEAQAEGLLVRFLPPGEASVSVHGWVVRQERGNTRHCQVGMQFGALPSETRHALIKLMFSSHQAWKGSNPASGLWTSVWAVIRGIPAAYVPYTPSRRRVPRIPCRQHGRLMAGAQDVDVQLRDISYSGLSLWIPQTHLAGHNSVAVLELDAITLKIRPQRTMVQDGGRLLVCSVESVEQGESEWAELHRYWWDKLYAPTAGVSAT
ncbi:MAG: glycosyltransferase [Nitrospira sp.]|nr:glycosyltransferase [Nitrospira sp.]